MRLNGNADSLLELVAARYHTSELRIRSGLPPSGAHRSKASLTLYQGHAPVPQRFAMYLERPARGGTRSCGRFAGQRMAERLCRRWTAPDIEQFVGLFAGDVVRVDHRRLSWDATGKTDQRAVLDS